MNILLYSTSTDANIQMLIVYKTIFLDIFLPSYVDKHK